MTRARTITALIGALASLAGAQTTSTWTDACGDAVVRRTDTGNNGPVASNGVLPDVVEVSISGWEAYAPALDPYSGQAIPGEDAHLFRLDVVLAGLANPPGTLGLAGFSFDPFKFGPSPVYGFVDLDVDGKNTGGELGAAATNRYLFNVGRFGGLPYGSIGERAARWSDDDDGNFFSEPQFERTGAEFSLVMCGCWNVTIVTQGGNGNGLFEAGETWVVRGRFFQRAGGYTGLSSVFGGSAFGVYDPYSNVRFSHDAYADRTTISLVYPLDMEGASMLTGQPEQAIDLSVSNHTSVVEALTDVIDGASGPLSGPLKEIAEQWRGRDAEDFLDPTEYDSSALLGTSYSSKQDTLYVWTDTGFGESFGDLDSDGLVGDPDESVFDDEVARYDGGVRDADGIVNGSIVLVNPGPGFAVFDLTGDAVIDALDRAVYCRADLEGDGDLDLFDFLAFQGLFADQDPRADFENDGDLDLFDFLAFQGEFAAGC